MDSDLNLSAERIADSEDSARSPERLRHDQAGPCNRATIPRQLADIITANRDAPAPRERSVWGALKGIKIDDLALRLLTAGITVCFAADLGADDDGQKNFRDIALWISRNLVSTRDRELALKVGVWGINRLVRVADL